MLISDSKRFLFVHVPKTGGSSLNRVLRSYSLPKPPRVFSLLRPFDLPSNYCSFRFLTHGPLATAERVMPRNLYRSYFKFAFVRNPWDRLVSEYNALLHKTNHRRHRRVMRLGGSFRDYLFHEAPRVVSSQVDLLIASDGRIGVDFVGRFEQLGDHALHVCQHLGIPFELPHANGYPRGHYREYYDDQTRDFVRSRWADDVQAFGYEF